MNPSECPALLETAVIIASVTPQDRRGTAASIRTTTTCTTGCSRRCRIGSSKHLDLADELLVSGSEAS